MMLSLRISLLAVVGMLAVATAAATAEPAGTTQRDSPKTLGHAGPSLTGLVRVRDGQELLRDCVPWIPRGLSFFGRLIPAGWQSDPGTTQAQREFGQWNVDAVKWFGGDVMRIQVGMPFLDPESPQHSPPYVQQIRDAVALVRRQGLSVILSLQYQKRTNVPAVESMPKSSARRAWRALGPVFANDWGVVYELFNEPVSPPQPSAKHWELWRAGHQAIIDDLRSAGIGNTLIIDGLNGAHTFRGAPELKDPLRQLAFGLHPYFREGYETPADWDDAFGDFARRHPTVVTEWAHAARKCDIAGIQPVEQLLNYLEKRRIGLVAYGADELANKLVARRGTGFAATSFRNRDCGQPGAGPGELLKEMFERSTQLNSTMKAVPAAACGLR